MTFDLYLYLFFTQETKKTEAALSELRRNYETEICELQCKIQRMQMVTPSIHLSSTPPSASADTHLCAPQIEEKYKSITVKDESPALKRKINELTLVRRATAGPFRGSVADASCSDRRTSG